MANGPKMAPIIAQKKVFAPLLSAIFQRRNAHDMVIIEMRIIPVMIQFLLCFAYNSQTTDTLRVPGVINLTGIITDMYQTSPPYNETGYSCRVWSVGIIIAYR